MKKQEHPRPFNLEHAKAGAPIAMRDGTEVDILKWDRKHTICIVGIDKQDASIRLWRADGSYSIRGTDDFDLVMTPLGFIDGKPVFVGDELVCAQYGTTARALTSWVGSWKPEQWRWPAPAKVNPETRMTDDELQAAAGIGQWVKSEMLAGVANAALRHAIDAGQVVLPFDGLLDAAGHVVYGSADDIAYVQRLILEPPQADEMRVSAQLESMALGKAERLLESLGYRSAGNGEWTAPAKGRHFYGQLDRFYVEGSEKSINVVRDLAERGLARDMAIAEAVHAACLERCENGSVSQQSVQRHVDLAGVIAKVPS